MASMMWRLITETKTKNLEKSTATIQYSCLENPMDRGTWRAAVHRVSQCQTQLKRLSVHKTKNQVILKAIQLGNLEKLHLCVQKSSKEIFIFVTLNGLQRNIYLGTCLAVKTLKFHPWLGELRSHMLALCGQKKKKRRRNISLRKYTEYQ